MKAAVFVLLAIVCAIECRKVLPINKNANVDFINMESGGGGRPVAATAPRAPARPAAPAFQPAKPQSPQPQATKPQSPQPQSPTNSQPKSPVPVVTTAKPVLVPVPTIPPAKEIKPTMPKPVQPINQDLEWKPSVGSGSVKDLVTFYDSKGKASVIRPYSYADAVKKN